MASLRSLIRLCVKVRTPYHKPRGPLSLLAAVLSSHTVRSWVTAHMFATCLCWALLASVYSAPKTRRFRGCTSSRDNGRRIFVGQKPRRRFGHLGTISSTSQINTANTLDFIRGGSSAQRFAVSGCVRVVEWNLPLVSMLHCLTWS